MSERSDVVYMDHAATTPMRPEAVAVMTRMLTDEYANPSGSHRLARRARKVLDESRDVVANAIGCDPGEVVFTGCGTESDNTAIAGAIASSGGTAVCPAAEHHAVLHCIEHVDGRVVAVGPDGSVDLADLERVLAETSDVAVVSVMAVNNETGAVTDLAAVARVVRRRAPRAVLHTDAVQAACWLDLREVWRHVDALALSAHKFGGPKGVGVLAVRNGVRLSPLLLGGGQERDRRSGTHNVAGIAAAAEALRVTDETRVDEARRIASLNATLRERIGALDGVRFTLPADRAVPGVLNVCFSGVENESLLFLLDEAGVCASAASACASGAMDPSHVLAAMGVPTDWARGSLRLSLGHTTTIDDVERAADAVVAAVDRIRRRTRAAS